jgi:N-acetylmuramoyl-L-alanine amidase
MKRGLQIIVAALCAGSGSLQAADWSLIKHEGRDYVTIGNVADFYGLGTVSRVNNDFGLRESRRSLRGAVGSTELYINGLKFILSYPVIEQDAQVLVSRMDLSKVIEPVMRPSRIKNAENVNTVILDPGHGGHDNGATCSLGMEKDFALDVAFRARDILQERGFRVYLTRTGDYFVPLEQRTRYANAYKNAIFISIHFNAGGTAATGVETYTLAPQGVPSMAADGPRVTDYQRCAGNSRDAENMALATATHSALVAYSGMYDRGIKRARFVVIRDITIPGVLIEGGFVSSSVDSRKLGTTQYRQQMAHCIAVAVRNYRRAVGSSEQPSVVVSARRPAVSDFAPAASAALAVGQSTANEPVVVTPTAH